MALRLTTSKASMGASRRACCCTVVPVAPCSLLLPKVRSVHSSSRVLKRKALIPKSSATPEASSMTDERRSEVWRGCKSVIAELAGLGMSPTEVTTYFQYVVKAPKGAPAGFELSRTAAVVRVLTAQDGMVSSVQDTEALRVVQLMLSDLWRWARRGGCVDEDGTPVHKQALRDLQNLTPTEDTSDQVTSILLDSLPISAEEKAEMSSGVQTLALASIQSFVWGSLAFTVVGLIAFNFLRTA